MKDVLKELRSMTVVCILLGPMLVLMSLGTRGAMAMIDDLQANPNIGPLELTSMHHLLFGFSEHAFWYMVALGIAFTTTGLIALRGGHVARRSMIVAGWIGIAGMIALTVVWVREVLRLDMNIVWHIVGIAAHMVQAALMVKGIFYLRSAPTIAAIDGSASAAASNRS